MRVLKAPGTLKRNSKHTISDLLSRFLARGKKAEDILREYIRKIIFEELKFFIDQNDQQHNEFSSVISEKPIVATFNYYQKLSTREIEVMDLTILEYNNRKIAARLNMKFNTLKNHNKNIHKKLKVTDRESACIVYRKLYNKPDLRVK